MSVLQELSDLRQRAVARLTELEPLVAEYQQLQSVLAKLGTDDLPRSASAAKPATRRRRSSAKAARKRATPAKRASGGSRRRRSAAAPGSRERDVVRLVSERPGISVPEIARELNVDPTGLYAIVRRLTAKGQMRKDGTKLEMVAAAS
jgi:DNA-binding NarL/FixJ family response regulator